MVTLRELAREDIPMVNRWRNDRCLVDGLGAPPRYISEEVDVIWFEEYLRRRGTDVRCAILAGCEAEPVGLVSLTGIDSVHRRAELHLIIGRRDLHGRGIGTEATRLLLAHAFNDLNLHRVFLSVLASNAPAIRVYEKAGFVREGVARESAYKRGRYDDMVHMAILAHEFACCQRA
jgi:RimJ/RimL family protein N-acetyltransferase